MISVPTDGWFATKREVIGRLVFIGWVVRRQRCEGLGSQRKGYDEGDRKVRSPSLLTDTFRRALKDQGAAPAARSPC